MINRSHYEIDYIVTVSIEYSGPPDPLHGNTPYLLVRSAAQDLSQLLFNVNTDDSELLAPQPVVMKSTGKRLDDIVYSTGYIHFLFNSQNILSNPFIITMISIFCYPL